MKQVIYIDVLVFLNTSVTFLLLLATSKIIKLTPSAGRYLCGALCGGAASLIIFAPDMGIMLSLVTKLLFSVIIVSSVYRPRKFKKLVKLTCYFFAVNFVFAGIMLGISSLPGISAVSYNNGIAYIDLSIFSLVAASVICYGVTAILNSITGYSDEGEILCSINMMHNGKAISMSAVIDTGNSLSDPFTGEGVVVASAHDIEPLMPDNIKSFLMGNTEGCGGIRLVPCSTVTGESLLPLFRVDELRINMKGENVVLQNVSVAVCSAEINNVILPSNITDNCKRRRKHEMVCREHT